MRSLSVVVVLAGAASCGRLGFGDDVGPAGQLRKPITITPRLSVALTDVPVSVVTNADAELAPHARPDGLDIQFTASDGSPLSYELVAYDASGSLEAWVRVPRLGDTAETTIFLDYGGDLRTPDPIATWASAAGVWHMAGSDTESDSSANGNPLHTSALATQPRMSGGIVGGARSFDGVDDQLSAGDPADQSLDVGTSSFTYAVWVNVVQSNTEFDIPLHKGGSTAAMPGFDMELGFINWNSCIADGGAPICALFGDESLYLSRWVSLVTVVDRSAAQLRTYANGQLTIARDITGVGSLDSPSEFRIGGYTVDPFHGVIDEVRVYRVALSAQRIAVEYANLGDRDAFMTIGNERTR